MNVTGDGIFQYNTDPNSDNKIYKEYEIETLDLGWDIHPGKMTLTHFKEAIIKFCAKADKYQDVTVREVGQSDIVLYQMRLEDDEEHQRRIVARDLKRRNIKIKELIKLAEEIGSNIVHGIHDPNHCTQFNNAVLTINISYRDVLDYETHTDCPS